MNQVIDKINKSKCAAKVRKNSFFKKHPTAKQMTKFAMIGIINNVIDFSIYIFLTRGFIFWRTHYLIANFFAFMVSILATFDIVRAWIFKLPILPRNKEEEKEMNLTKAEERLIHIQYFKFLLVSSTAFSFNELGLFIFVDFIKINDILAKAIVGLAIWGIRFNSHRLWTFQSKETTEQ